MFVITSSIVMCLKGTNITYSKCQTPLRNGTIIFHCCDNEEDKNGLCVECEVGFISDRGESCQPCRNGLYGRKCGDSCHCYEYEVCHHVVGCLNITYETSSTKVTSESAFTENSKPSEMEPELIGTLKIETVIYVICTSGVTFVMILCVVTLNRYRKRNKSNLNIHPVVEREINENKSIEVEDQYERVYDLIDESKMIDMPIQHPIPTVESSIDLSANEESSLSDGYLNPYQPIISDPTLHYYSKTKSVNDTDNLNKKHQPDDSQTSNRLSTNEVIPLQKKNSSDKISPPSLVVGLNTEMTRSDYISMNQNDIEIPVICNTKHVFSTEASKAT